MYFSRIIMNIFKPNIKYQFTNISALTLSMSAFSIYGVNTILTECQMNSVAKNKPK